MRSKHLFIVAIVFSLLYFNSTSLSAQMTKGSIKVNLTHANWSSACAHCVKVRLIATVIYNGYPVSIASNEIYLNPGNSTILSASLPFGATSVVDSRLIFSMHGGTVIQDLHELELSQLEMYYATPHWCCDYISDTFFVEKNNGVVTFSTDFIVGKGKSE